MGDKKEFPCNEYDKSLSIAFSANLCGIQLFEGLVTARGVGQLKPQGFECFVTACASFNARVCALVYGIVWFLRWFMELYELLLIQRSVRWFQA